MTPASGQPSGGSGEQRVKCLYCGANNFANSVSCWQCNRSLVALREPAHGGQAAAPHAGGPDARALMGAPAPNGFGAQSRPLGFGSLGPAAANAAASASRATKTAALMGLLFPWIGLPLGMVFLMLEDEQKAKIGWITIYWSLAGFAINIIGGIILMVPLMAGLHSLIPSGALHAPRSDSSSPSLPDLGGGDLNLVRILGFVLHLFSAPL